jgi:hypothetical protein
MISIAKSQSQRAKTHHDQLFLQLIPGIQRCAQTAFRNMGVEERDDATCEVVAHAFCAFRRLVELGKQDLAYATPLARFAVARLRSGRRIGAKLNSCDVYASASRCRQRVNLEGMESTCSGTTSWLENLVDNTATPIADQAAFRIDFRAWLKGLQPRLRKLALYLALGYSTSEAAHRFRVSRARISQLRRELASSWQTLSG